MSWSTADLVTNMSALGGQSATAGTDRLVDAIRDAILNPPAEALAGARPATDHPGKRRVLIMLSEWGYWGEELVGRSVSSTGSATRSSSARPPGVGRMPFRSAWTPTSSIRRCSVR